MINQKINITTKQVRTAVCSFISSLTDFKVYTSQQNRVSAPKHNHIMVTLLWESMRQYPAQRLTKDKETCILANTNTTFQIDCYSIDTEESATVSRNIAQMTRTHYAIEFLSAYGISPIRATEPKNMYFINDASQYEQRHMFELTVNYNPTITIAQDVFSDATISIIPVDEVNKKEEGFK